jgi:hypothetical protein
MKNSEWQTYQIDIFGFIHRIIVYSGAILNVVHVFAPGLCQC